MELALLPNWTGAFPVVSVAGHVRVMASVLGVPITSTGDAGDLIVGPTSALTAPFDVQGTHLKRDISCGDLTLDALLLATIPIGSSLPTCWHKYEPSSPRGGQR